MFSVAKLKYLYAVIVLVMAALLLLSQLYERALSDADQHALAAQAEVASTRFIPELRAGHYRAIGDAFGSDSPNIAMEIIDLHGTSLFRSREVFTAVRCAVSSYVDGRWAVRLCRVEGPFKSFLEEVRKRAQLLMALAVALIGAAILIFIRVVRKSVQTSAREIAAVTGQAEIPEDAPLPRLLEFLTTQRHVIDEFQKSIATKARFAAVGEIASQFQHDLRDPMHVIGIAMRSMPADAKIKGDAMNALAQIRQMMSDVKNFSGSLQVRTEYVVLRRAVDDAVAQFKLREADVAVDVGVTADLVVQADPSALHRVLGNLLNNAVEAGSPRVEIGGEPLAGDGFIQLSVSDWGSGIDPAVLKDLSKPFASHGKSEGTGLGLWHATQVIEAMGGGVQIASPGKGGASTTVVIKLLARGVSQ